MHGWAKSQWFPRNRNYLPFSAIRSPLPGGAGAEALRQWLARQRGQVPDGSATRKAIECSLGRSAALIRYIDDCMSLIQSAKLNGHDPYRCLRDILERLPTQPASRLDELLPHKWNYREHL
jgi:transposase